MSNQQLNGKMVAILATDGFEESELFSPKEALENEGVEITIVSLKEGLIKAWSKKQWGREIEVDMVVDAATAANFDALVLPGGVMNPDSLRMNEAAVNFVADFAASEKPIAAICHGSWTLIEADVVRDRTLTSWPSLKTDLINAGANWVDEEVAVDNNFITSRKPADLVAFNRAIIESLSGRPFAEKAPSNKTQGGIKSMH